VAERRNKNFVGLLASGVVVVAAPLLGLTVTNFKLQSAFRQAASTEPSQKARLLAEGISQSMPATAYGLVVSLLALVSTIVFAVRFYRDSKRGR
jgi:biopolymer transport protein ExbB/TolQ